MIIKTDKKYTIAVTIRSITLKYYINLLFFLIKNMFCLIKHKIFLTISVCFLIYVRAFKFSVTY